MIPKYMELCKKEKFWEKQQKERGKITKKVRARD